MPILFKSKAHFVFVGLNMAYTSIPCVLMANRLEIPDAAGNPVSGIFLQFIGCVFRQKKRFPRETEIKPSVCALFSMKFAEAIYFL